MIVMNSNQKLIMNAESVSSSQNHLEGGNYELSQICWMLNLHHKNYFGALNRNPRSKAATNHFSPHNKVGYVPEGSTIGGASHFLHDRRQCSSLSWELSSQPPFLYCTSQYSSLSRFSQAPGGSINDKYNQEMINKT